MDIEVVGEPHPFPRCPVDNDELREMVEKLYSYLIEDGEDILDWFGEYGISLIEEVLAYRER